MKEKKSKQIFIKIVSMVSYFLSDFVAFIVTLIISKYSLSLVWTIKFWLRKRIKSDDPHHFLTKFAMFDTTICREMWLIKGASARMNSIDSISYCHENFRDVQVYRRYRKELVQIW